MWYPYDITILLTINLEALYPICDAALAKGDFIVPLVAQLHNSI